VEGGGGGLTVSGVSRNRGGFVRCVAIQKRLRIPALNGTVYFRRLERRKGRTPTPAGLKTMSKVVHSVVFRNVSIEAASNLDYGGCKDLWNVANLLTDYTAQHPRRQTSSCSNFFHGALHNSSKSDCQSPSSACIRAS
jgi:hypothetical protein